jgi:tetratricopeptide (TPR) repeat protein
LSLSKRLRAGHEDFESIGALATLLADSGDTTAAEAAFSASRRRYRGVSPIPLALLDFQRGHMWMQHGDYDAARTWFESAMQLLPGYVEAIVHLAEVESKCGELESAIAKLRRLTSTSDDPDVFAELSHVLELMGEHAEAVASRASAVAGYDDLVSRRPEAYADHLARFLLDHGVELTRALELAELNFCVRQTAGARALLDRAREAAR